MAGDPQSGTSPLEGPSYHAVLMDEGQKVDPRYWLVFQERARASAIDLAGRECLPLVVGSGLPIGTWWCAQTSAAGGQVWRPRTRENAANLAAGYEARLRAGMTPSQADALLDAAELVHEGAAFREYVAAPDPAGHWTDWQPTDLRGTRFVLVGDLGIRWPHFALAAHDVERGRWVILREWAPDDATVGDVCRTILREACPRKDWTPTCGRLPVDQVVIDPAGRARGADGRSQSDLFGLPAPEGLGMRPLWEQDAARMGVADGIDRVNMALYRKALMFSRPMMEAGLRAHHERRTLARCMTGYRWDPRDPSKPMKDNRNDHGADAVRYLVRHVLWHLGANVAAEVRAPEAPRPQAGDMAFDAR